MKRTNLILVALLLGILLTGCSSNSNTTESQTTPPTVTTTPNTQEPTQEEVQEEVEFQQLTPAEVRVEGDTIFYTGDIHEESIQQVKDLYTENITRLVLDSLGGEINNGMDLGDFVFEKELDVEIRNTAFSSAANYVALAAKTLYLNPDSLLGFHGGAIQDAIAYEGISPEEQAALDEYLEASIERETAFYEKIGVNQQITVIGQDEKFDDRAQNAVGYTYTLEALEALGVDNIELIDETWNTPTTFADDDSDHLFIIDKVDLE